VINRHTPTLTISDVPTCFVIQPFDGGRFDKRYQQVYKPAIESADLIAYRVDEDVLVDIPIESIESGIRASSVCLADITTDNPNVWYELGFAFAVGRPVVIVCARERDGKKFPFDIQHRSIIQYDVDAPDDFSELRSKITNRIKALLEKGETIRQIAEADQLAPLGGLSHPELAILAVVAGSVDTHVGMASLYGVKQDVERAGLTKLGFTLGLKRLSSKSYVEIGEDSDYNEHVYAALKVTRHGWDWIEANERLFVLRQPNVKADDGTITDDDIPF